MRRAKIVATLGPALNDPERLKAALEAGIDVVRLNFAHGTHEGHATRLEQVRKMSREIGRPVGSLGDLQGPKIRLGQLPEEGVDLPDGGDAILISGREELDAYDDGTGTPVLPVMYGSLADDVEPGALVLMDDGLIRLVVSGVEDNHVHCRVVAGGSMSSRKGVNLPGVAVSAKILTDKDRHDLEAAIDMGLDWIALSFVRKPDDIVEARDMIRGAGGDQPIVAKLERPEVLDNLRDTMEETDAVMVARGDLGTEVGPERVPALQKEIIALANAVGKPVITATEMLESMIRSPRPTRAEASDVANAVFDGTDALMLSGETATGRFPVEAVRTMARIIEAAEGSPRFGLAPPERLQESLRETAVGRIVARAAVQVAEDVHAKALVVFSFSGESIQRVSKFRPGVPIVGLTPRTDTLGRLALLWGTTGDLVPHKDNIRDLIIAAEETCLSEGYGELGDPIVIVSGIPGGHGGTRNVLVHRLGHVDD
ncbi:MAG: pyruvate kinase [Actinomycetota bacterium]|nr:pyruvate kinase [Actinomycetota bacterium]